MRGIFMVTEKNTEWLSKVLEIAEKICSISHESCFLRSLATAVDNYTKQV